jgi:hypothetical protein
MAKPSRQAVCYSKSVKLVDEARIFAYLAATMTRHFFALLALLTGLAALGSPAQASLAETLVCKSSIAATAGQETAASRNIAAQPVPASLRQSRALAGAQPRSPAAVALRLPVLMGIERAIE